MTRARVLNFFIDADQTVELTDAIEEVTGQFSHFADFRGLLCLESDGARNEIIVITLWDGDGLEATEAVSEAGRHRIAATSDLGVSCKLYNLLRQLPGSVVPDAVEALA